jgi:hypothetical protein
VPSPRRCPWALLPDEAHLSGSSLPRGGPRVRGFFPQLIAAARDARALASACCESHWLKVTPSHSLCWPLPPTHRRSVCSFLGFTSPARTVATGQHPSPQPVQFPNQSPKLSQSLCASLAALHAFGHCRDAHPLQCVKFHTNNPARVCPTTGLTSCPNHPVGRSLSLSKHCRLP